VGVVGAQRRVAAGVWVLAVAGVVGVYGVGAAEAAGSRSPSRSASPARTHHGGTGPGITADQALVRAGYTRVQDTARWRQLVGGQVTGVGDEGLAEFAVTTDQRGQRPRLRLLDPVTGALDVDEDSQSVEKLEQQGYSFFVHRPGPSPVGQPPSRPFVLDGIQAPRRVHAFLRRLDPESMERRALEHIYAHPTDSFNADDLINQPNGTFRNDKLSSLRSALSRLWRHNFVEILQEDGPGGRDVDGGARARYRALSKPFGAPAADEVGILRARMRPTSIESQALKYLYDHPGDSFDVDELLERGGVITDARRDAVRTRLHILEFRGYIMKEIHESSIKFRALTPEERARMW
jgi:hypothetical protein